MDGHAVEWWMLCSIGLFNLGIFHTILTSASDTVSDCLILVLTLSKALGRGLRSC